MKIKFIILLLIALFSTKTEAKEVKLLSPDKKLNAVIDAGRTVSVTVFDDASALFSIDEISIDTDKGTFPAPNATIRKTDRKTVSREIVPPVKEKQASIPENYNEATVRFSGWRLIAISTL